VKDEVVSKNSVPIRLTAERWQHIVTEHAELSESREEILRTIAAPDHIFVGSYEELLAIREIEVGKWLVVVYRELEDDGFVITAFWTRRYRSFGKRKILWSR
jgi:hypothetical protein